jgi:hypothetical protein
LHGGIVSSRLKSFFAVNNSNHLRKGYRLIFVREINRVQLRTKDGHDYAKRFPLIVESADGSTALMAHCSWS